MTRPAYVAAAAAVIAWLTALAAASPETQAPAPSAGEAPHGAALTRPTFLTSENCIACHNSLTTPAGEDVSIGAAWRASMMANSARDPYWLAGVRREILDHPAAQAEIEDECSICHMPLARTLAVSAGGRGAIFRLVARSEAASPERRFALDGVSCALCHQIGTDRLGTPDSFVGGFVIAPGPPRMLGPYEVDPGHAALMRSSTTVEPAQAAHIRQSEVCATCHTLFTQALAPDGTHPGSLPEQVPYLEWRHSAYREERSCQACHMPAATSTPITSVLGEPREALGRHSFIGANYFMLRMLNRFRSELGVEATPQELDTAAHATIRHLQSDTATVAVNRMVRNGTMLEIDVNVRNLAGHKLPTGYPSRRVWLELTVRDEEGRTRFESGTIAENGAIRGNDNDTDPLRVEPHYAEIRRPDEVQIYEAAMVDAAGRVTTGLLQGVAYVKDNRLLPRGFDKMTAPDDVAVRGHAAADADFTGGSDRVRYLVDVSAARGPRTVVVALRYQTIAFRWADNLRRYDAPEPRRFVSFYDSMAASSSVVLASASAVAP